MQSWLKGLINLFKRTTACLFLCTMITALLLCSCNSSESMVSVSGSEDTKEAESEENSGVDSNVEDGEEQKITLSVDQTNLILSIPKTWEDIASFDTEFDGVQSDGAEYGTPLFRLYEKTAHSAYLSMGYVWGLYVYTDENFQSRFGDIDTSQVIGVESYMIGKSNGYTYLLTEPGDVQFLEDDPTSIEQYQQLQEESQPVIEGFLKDNGIPANQHCPDSPCYTPAK